MIRRPASLHAVPRCAGVPALRRYYQGAATSCHPSRRASFTFARRYRRCVRRFAPAGRERAAGGPGLVGVRPAHAGMLFDGDGGISQVPGEPPLHLRRALRPRQDQGRPTDCDAPARPPWRERRGLLHCGFRGSIPRLRCSLSTLRPGGRPPGTQDSLPAAGQALPGGLGTRRVPTRGFRVCPYISSSSPKLAWRKAALRAAVRRWPGSWTPAEPTASNESRDAMARLRERQGLLHCGFRGSIPRL